MQLEMNPAMLRAAYDYLAETYPFNKWNLPAGEDIGFHVSKSKENYGCAYWEGKKLHIAISSRKQATTAALMATLAHEMVHIYQMHHKMRQTSDHDASWQALAKRVCKHHGFDPKAF